MEKDKCPHHRCIYVSSDGREKMVKDSAYNLKMDTNGCIGRTPGLQGVAYQHGIRVQPDILVSIYCWVVG